MDRKDIIRILADLDPISDAGLASLSIETLERFSALIAAAEREECAKACEALDAEAYKQNVSGFRSLVSKRRVVEAIRERGQS